ncbi:MAG: ABC transporter permease [Spirochaetales bacterium]|nr:ABC transporter permease [Spirochaetales bacterium]
MSFRIAKTAFKNISRNMRRSILSGTAIAVASMSIVALFALIGGMSQDMKNNLRNFYTGDVRVRNKDYEEYERFNPVHLTVNINKAGEAISKIDGIESWVPRVSFPSSIYIDGSTFSAIGTGVDLERERNYFDLDSIVVAGRLPERGKKEMIMGAVLARNLHLELGDKITFQTMTADRSTNAITLKITGLAAFPVASLNSKYFWMPLDRAQDFLNMPGEAQEILVKTSHNIKPLLAAEKLSAALSSSGTELEVKQLEDISMMFGLIRMAETVYNIIGIFFFLLGSTVIINTTMMVIFERMREIGTLSALGMHGRELVKLFLLEGTFISAIGAAVGVAAGILLVAYLSKTGIDFTDAMSGMEFEMSSILYPKLNAGKTIFVYFYAVAIACLATLIPSRKASKIQPVEALRYI